MNEAVSSDRPLFLHEVVDISGHNGWPYMRHTFEASGDEKVNFRLQGTWYTMGITGRWPQVVNIWEVPGGWEGWRVAVDRLNLERPKNEALEAWWLEALDLRSGGFDRLLLAAPGCPTTDELVSAGVRGSLFVHELAEVRPGSQLEYLAAVREQRAPLLAEYGHTLCGLFEVAFCDHEVVTTWATDVHSHVTLGIAHDVAAGLGEGAPDARLASWRKRARDFVVRGREELMTPYPGIPIGPEPEVVE